MVVTRSPLIAANHSASFGSLRLNSGLSGYARLDFRLNVDGKFYLLEANPNPNLANGEDFAELHSSSCLLDDDR